MSSWLGTPEIIIIVLTVIVLFAGAVIGIIVRICRKSGK
jgi:hypothetical protein